LIWRFEVDRDLVVCRVDDQQQVALVDELVVLDLPLRVI